MTENVVELRDVFCVHRTAEGDAAALQGIHLDLAWGEVLCVLGPSGAGKSTLLRVIAGVQTPSAGTVSVLGCDVSRMRASARARLRHQQLGFLDQYADTMLSPDLCVGAALALPLALRGVPRRERRSRVAELLDAAGLAERAGARPSELSGGERQRAALCAALAHRPELLLADEPTGELDAAGAEVVRALILERARRERTSVIVVSHDPASAALADRVVRIRDGRVVEERNHGEDALVVDRHGWVRLPDEQLARAGITSRARVSSEHGRLTLAPARFGPAPSASAAPAAAPPGLPARVELRAVTRGYGQRLVLRDFTHAFAPGALNVVTGPSGAGKTTLLRLVVGLDRAEAGEVTIDATPLGERDAEALAALRRERIGYLPQEPAPVGFLSALENIVLVLRLRGRDAGLAAGALERVGLAGRARQRVHRLSAGEAQRVALARALASARGLLIADEPSSRLDESGARMVAELLAAAAREDGHTVICATHDPVLMARADQVVELSGGAPAQAKR